LKIGTPATEYIPRVNHLLPIRKVAISKPGRRRPSSSNSYAVPPRNFQTESVLKYALPLVLGIALIAIHCPLVTLQETLFR